MSVPRRSRTLHYLAKRSALAHVGAALRDAVPDRACHRRDFLEGLMDDFFIRRRDLIIALEHSSAYDPTQHSPSV